MLVSNISVPNLNLPFGGLSVIIVVPKYLSIFKLIPEAYQ